MIEFERIQGMDVIDFAIYINKLQMQAIRNYENGFFPQGIFDNVDMLEKEAAQPAPAHSSGKHASPEVKDNKQVFCLCEEHEDSDAIRQFEIIAISSDKTALRKLMEAKISRDEYGMVSNNGVGLHDDDHFMTEFDCGFVEYYILNYNVLSREEVNRMVQSQLPENGELPLNVALMDAAAIEYKGILFDEWNVDENGTVWAEMCEGCANKYMGLISNELDDGSAIGTCSVFGCNVSGMESEGKHYYVDFEPQLIHPLTKEQLLQKENSSLDDKIKTAEQKSAILNTTSFPDHGKGNHSVAEPERG